MATNFPLYHLFLKLRNEGFSLGTEQYLLLIKALHHKKYLLDLSTIQNTCQILWANSKEEIWIFNRHFNLMVRSQAEVMKEMEQVTEEEKQKTKGRDKTLKNEPINKNNPSKAKKTEETTSDTSAKADQGQDLTGSSPSSLPGQFSPEESRWQEQFLMEGSVSPITLRQMQQSWRYLRRWKNEGAKTEIDLQKTFESIAQTGFFTEPVRTAPRVNTIELLLLVDRNGSMLPFHGLLEELVHSAIHGGRFNNARCLYFHDYPTKYLYQQPQMIEEIALDQLATELNSKRTVVMVISDAGAARRTFSEKRVKRTQTLKNYLKENTANFVWLNPMPQDRWEGCSAEDIADFFPMFEVNQEGLNQAIDVLRGKVKVK